MRTPIGLIALTLSLTLGGFVNATPSPAEDLNAVSPTRAGSWVVKKSDNVCGIADRRKISKPAQVDYPKLLEATPQIKEMKRDGVDPNSTRGKALRNKAATLITKTCQLIRRDGGYCGVWKVIRHEDGRIVPDVTDDVKSQLD